MRYAHPKSSTAQVPGMARLTREPYRPPILGPRPVAPRAEDASKDTLPPFFPRRDVYSHLACGPLDVDDFDMGYFLRCRGNRHAVEGRCMRCDDLVYAGTWVFVVCSGDILYHFDCAGPLVVIGSINRTPTCAAT